MSDTGFREILVGHPSDLDVDLDQDLGGQLYD